MTNGALTGKQAFIWDLDGTLLDSYGVIVSSLHRAYLEAGLTLDKDEILREIISQTVSYFTRKMENERGIAFETIKERYSEISEQEKLNIKPIKNASEILSFLNDRGIPNYVFTHRGVSTEPILKNIGLYEFFDEIVTGKDGFGRKPDPSALNYLVQKYNLDKNSTFYVGDRSLDIECANNAGLMSILYLPEDSAAKPTGKETFIVKDLLEIRDIVSGKRDDDDAG